MAWYDSLFGGTAKSWDPKINYGSGGSLLDGGSPFEWGADGKFAGLTDKGKEGLGGAFKSLGGAGGAEDGGGESRSPGGAFAPPTIGPDPSAQLAAQFIGQGKTLALPTPHAKKAWWNVNGGTV